MSVLRFTVPWRPVGVNAQYERHPGGVHKSERATLFHGAVANYGLLARRKANFQTLLRPAPVDVLIRFYTEKLDADAAVKTVLDALQIPNLRLGLPGASIYENDDQVHDHHVQKRIDPFRPRVVVIVGPAGEVFSLSLHEAELEALS